MEKTPNDGFERFLNSLDGDNLPEWNKEIIRKLRDHKGPIYISMSRQAGRTYFREKILEAQQILEGKVAMDDEKFIHLDESKWPKVNPNVIDNLFKAEEDPVFKAVYNYTVKVVDNQDELMMQTIQRIGGEHYHTITIDKNKVVEALKMYKTMQWTSVDEGLPENDGFYIVNIGDVEYGRIAIHRYHGKSQKWLGAQAGSVIEGVTHWMPLPNTPVGKNMYW